MKTDFLKLELPQSNDFVNVLTQISANYQVLDLYAKNQNGIKIIAGKGLTGGGTLNADITLNLVSSNEGITIEENSITLNVLNFLNSTDQEKPVSADALRRVNEKADDKLPKGTYTGTAKDLEDEINTKMNNEAFVWKKLGVFKSLTERLQIPEGANEIMAQFINADDKYIFATHLLPMCETYRLEQEIAYRDSYEQLSCSFNIDSATREIKPYVLSTNYASSWIKLYWR